MGSKLSCAPQVVLYVCASLILARFGVCGEPDFLKRYYDIPEVVAIVDGAPISREDFIARLLCDHGVEVLRSMVTLMLIEGEARRRGISATDKEVLERFNPLFEALKKKETEKLMRAGLPPNISPMMLWAEAKKYVLLEKMLRNEIRIDDVEMRRYYYRPQVYKRFNPDPVYDVREIGVLTPEEANAIWGELLRAQRERKDIARVFSTLALKHSKMPTAKLLGSRGYLSLDELPHEYKLILRAAKPGEIFPPTQVQIDGVNYWVILWVRDIKVPPKVPFEEAKAEIEKELFSEQLALRARAFISELWDKALKEGKIKVMVAALKELVEKGAQPEKQGEVTRKR